MCMEDNKITIAILAQEVDFRLKSVDDMFKDFGKKEVKSGIYKVKSMTYDYYWVLHEVDTLIDDRFMNYVTMLAYV